MNAFISFVITKNEEERKKVITVTAQGKKPENRFAFIKTRYAILFISNAISKHVTYLEVR